MIPTINFRPNNQRILFDEIWPNANPRITMVNVCEPAMPPIDGVILTKMDGTARGGIAVPIMTELNLPIYFILNCL